MSSALRAELSEYSSLIRALRARDTLDISTQLSRPKPADDDKDNHWTRWPLLPVQLHNPEWSFEDEIAVIIDQSTSSAHNSDLEDLSPHVIQNVIGSAEHHLSQILHLIASLVPPAPESTHCRLDIFGWENVLDIVSASGIIGDRFVAGCIRKGSFVHLSALGQSRA
jgi:hypothetical protein